MSQYRFTQNYEELQTIFNRAEQGGEIDQNISAKYTKPATGIPATDLTSALQTTISGSEQTANKRTSTQGWSASPSDTNYTSEKLVADRFATTERANAIQQREIDNLKEALADTTTIQYPDTTYQKGTVPSGVCKYASVNKIIGASKKTKNLIPYTLQALKSINTTGTWNGGAYTLNGLTFTVNSDCTISISGTSTATTVFYIKQLLPLNASTTYKIVGCPLGGNWSNTYGLNALESGNNPHQDLGSGNTFTTTSATTLTRVEFLVRTNNTLNNLLVKPMLTTDTSATYSDYEQYFEGIKSATITKVTEVKNLLDAGTLNDIKAINTGGTWNNNVYTYNGVTFTVNDDGTYTVNGTASGGSKLELSSNEFNAGLKLVGCPTGGSYTSYYLAYYAWKSGYTDAVGTLDYGNGGIASLHDGRTIFATRIVVASGITISNLVFKPMITTDLTATYADFVKHEVHELVLPEPFIGRSAGTVADEYTPITGVIDRSHLKDVDLGNLSWGYQAQWGTSTNVFFASVPGLIAVENTNDKLVCGMYESVRSSDMYNNDVDKRICINIINNVPCIRITNHSYTDATAFRNAMNGVILTYQLATPDPSQNQQVTPINPFIQCESGGQLSLVHTESPATESRFVVEFANKQ